MKSRARRRTSIALVLFATGLVVGPATAQEDAAEERGREIAGEADRRQRGFGDYQAGMEMVLTDRRGRETVRELDLRVLEVGEGEERSLVFFNSPRDIRGTALLTHSYANRDNEQWLYLPALRRTKRISASGRSSPFMGSEFAYEDLVTTDVSQYSYRYLGEDELDGTPCFLVERVPRYDGTGYEKELLWIDVEEYRVLRIDYWDVRGRELKSMTLSSYRLYPNGLWKPDQAQMVNHRTGETTILRWLNYRFQTDLDESDFSRSALGRPR